MSSEAGGETRMVDKSNFIAICEAKWARMVSNPRARKDMHGVNGEIRIGINIQKILKGDGELAGAGDGNGAGAVGPDPTEDEGEDDDELIIDADELASHVLADDSPLRASEPCAGAGSHVWVSPDFDDAMTTPRGN